MAHVFETAGDGEAAFERIFAEGQIESSFLSAYARFPVGVGHRELIQIGEQRPRISPVSVPIHSCFLMQRASACKTQTRLAYARCRVRAARWAERERSCAGRRRAAVRACRDSAGREAAQWPSRFNARDVARERRGFVRLPAPR